MAHFQTLNHSFALWFIHCRIYFSGKIFHPFESQLVRLLPCCEAPAGSDGSESGLQNPPWPFHLDSSSLFGWAWGGLNSFSDLLPPRWLKAISALALTFQVSHAFVASSNLTFSWTLSDPSESTRSIWACNSSYNFCSLFRGLVVSVFRFTCSVSASFYVFLGFL